MPGAGGEGNGRQRVLGRRSVLLVVLGGVLTTLSIVSLWSWRTFASSQGFADVATDMLKEPAIREEVADRIIEGLQTQSATSRITLQARPVLEQVVERVVETDAFQGIFHASVRQVHSAIVEGIRSRMVIPVDDSAQLVKDSLEAFNSSAAAAIPDEAVDLAIDLSQGTPADALIVSSSIAGWLALPFAVAGLVSFFFAVRCAIDRRRAIEAIGFCLVIIGVGLFAVLAVGVSLFAQFSDDVRQRTALRAVFWSVAHLLNVQAKVTITIGAVLVVAASYVGKGRPAGRFRDLWEGVTRALNRPNGKVAVSLLGIASAIFAMAFPAATAAIAVRIGAFVAFVAGTVALLDVIGEREWTIGRSPRVQEASKRLVAGSVGVIAALSVLLLFGGVAFARALRAPSADRPSIAESGGCNGAIELCDLRVDEVVFAGTHNSMAASNERGWFGSRHFDGIAGQLARGIRAFLIDVHYGVPSHNDVVRTDFGGEAERRAARQQLTFTQAAYIDSFFSRLGSADPSGRSHTYLCHIYCEMGATRASDAFRDMHDFLRENPNEVIILVLEDHVAPADAIDAFEDGDLANRVYPWQPGEPLPTLREMIVTERNVLVLAESEGGGEEWYVPAYDGALMDTQYRFKTVDNLRGNCFPGRGALDSPLFLMNHWVGTDPPDPEVAEQANAAGVLESRIESCQEVFDRRPNIIAVDFSTKGDLLDVVDALNGVTESAEP